MKKITLIRARNGVLVPSEVKNGQNRTVNGSKGSKHGMKNATNSIFGPKNICFLVKKKIVELGVPLPFADFFAPLHLERKGIPQPDRRHHIDKVQHESPTVLGQLGVGKSKS